MASRMYRVSELAELTRVTVRTLHHYDAVGLLVPKARSAGGYRTERYTADDWAAIKAEMDSMLSDMAALAATDARPGDVAAMDVAEKHRRHIDRWFYPCAPLMHAGLADMYTADDRFRATFEAHGEGLAEFFAGAVQANAARGERRD